MNVVDSSIHQAGWSISPAHGVPGISRMPREIMVADPQHLDDAMHKLGMSARGYYKVLKVARTIANLLGYSRV